MNHPARRLPPSFRSSASTAGKSAALLRFPGPAVRIATSARPYLMSITIDAGLVTSLRHVIVAACGELVECIRVQPVRRDTQVEVTLSLNRPAVDLVMDAVMGKLPRAEFGRLTAAAVGIPRPRLR